MQKADNFVRATQSLSGLQQKIPSQKLLIHRYAAPSSHIRDEGRKDESYLKTVNHIPVKGVCLCNGSLKHHLTLL